LSILWCEWRGCHDFIEYCKEEVDQELTFNLSPNKGQFGGSHPNRVGVLKDMYNAHQAQNREEKHSKNGSPWWYNIHVACPTF
jgi:hypothetical protein